VETYGVRLLVALAVTAIGCHRAPTPDVAGAALVTATSSSARASTRAEPASTANRDSAESPAAAASSQPFGADQPDAAVLTPDMPVAAPAASPAAAPTCPAWLSRGDAPRVRLEKLATSGDACAKSALARVLLAGWPEVDDFRRALRLASEAQDARVLGGECQLFALARDFLRRARCYEANSDHRSTSLEYVSGRVFPRDLSRARQELERDESKDCGYTSLLAIIDAEQATPTQRVYDFCQDAACTTLDLNACGSDENFRHRLTSARIRLKVREALDVPGRAALDHLLRDFARYADADSSQAYYRFIDGTVRNAVALNAEAGQAQRFDAALQTAAIAHSLSAVTAAEIKASRAELAQLDRGALAENTSMRADGTAAFHREYRAAAAAYQLFESSWVAFVARVLGGGADSERAARGLAIKNRIELLKKSSNFFD
jgi:hypothetical protein